ncbi:hypothetical protein Zm00014a_030306, partial [Zea mays]
PQLGCPRPRQPPARPPSLGPVQPPPLYFFLFFYFILFTFCDHSYFILGRLIIVHAIEIGSLI